MKLKCYCTTKETVIKMTKLPTEWEKLHACHAFYKIYKLVKIRTKQSNISNSIEKDKHKTISLIYGTKRKKTNGLNKIR